LTSAQKTILSRQKEQHNLQRSQVQDFLERVLWWRFIKTAVLQRHDQIFTKSGIIWTHFCLQTGQSP